MDPTGSEKRGTPTVAAVLALFLVGVAALGYDNFTAPATVAAAPQSQTAQAAGAGSGSSLKIGAPQNCTDAIKAALGQQKGPPASAFDQGSSGTLDACFGAVLKEGRQPSQNPTDYECVGRSGTVQVGSVVTTLTSPNADVSKGYCKMRVCNQANYNKPPCGPTELYGSGETVPLPAGALPPPAPSAPTGIGAPLPSSQTGQTPASGDPAGSREIGSVFDTRTQPVPYLGMSGQGASGDLQTLNGLNPQNPGVTDIGNAQGSGTPTSGDPQGEGAASIDKALGYNAKALDPSSQGSGAPDPSKPYYIQRGDEWCDQTGKCKPASTFTPPPGQGGPQAKPSGGPGGADPADAGRSGLGGLGGLGPLLNGLMQGLLKGLSAPKSPSPSSAPAQACSTDPNVYAQQQQQYQQQLQQYNYQLQQYQHQRQLDSYYGNTYSGASPPMQPTPCTPSTQQQCGSQPPQPAASTCSGGSWTPQRSGSCVVGWQCTNLGAQLSCSPGTAVIGQTLTLSYSCAKGAASGSGFTASGQSGTTTVTVAEPPSGTDVATYTLTCTEGSVTSGAQCSVKIVRPNIIFVANPATVSSGGKSLLGWLTTGMRSCVVHSPSESQFTIENSANTSVAGSVETPALSQTTQFDLTCLTLGDTIMHASTVVEVPGTTLATPSGITISTTNGAVVNHGDSIDIAWSSTSEPPGARVALWIWDIDLQSTTALIAGNQPTSGSYHWVVPAASSPCDLDTFNICGADLVAGSQYQIEADVYIPSNAYVGDGPAPADPISPMYGDYADSEPFTIGN